MKTSSVYLLLLIILAAFGLIYSAMSSFGAGTHGSIVAYQFPVPKTTLQRSVEKVLASSPNIYNDTVPDHIIDMTEGRNDTNFSNYYNDGEKYLTVDIKTEEDNVRYIFRYSGSEEDWDTSKTSAIAIAYAYDKNSHEGGSKGGGEISWHTPQLKKRIIELFEQELISKVEKEVGASNKSD